MLAKKYNLKVSEIQEIVESPFKFFAQIASEGDRETMQFHSVRIIKFGVFAVKKGRREYFKKLNDDRSKKEL